MDFDDADMLIDQMSVDDDVTPQSMAIDALGNAQSLPTQLFPAIVVEHEKLPDMSSTRSSSYHHEGACSPRSDFMLVSTSPMQRIETILTQITSTLHSDAPDLAVRLRRRTRHNALSTDCKRGFNIVDTLIGFPGKTKQEAWQFSQIYFYLHAFCKCLEY